MAATETSTPVASAEDWVRGFEEGWDAARRPEDVAAYFGPRFTPDAKLIQPQIPTGAGRQGILDFARPLFTLMPDVRVTVDDWAVRGDTALIEITVAGTLGGKPVAFQAVDRITLRDGLAIERRTYTDPAPLVLAVLKRPRAWLPFARSQAIQIKQRLRGSRA
jgi:ketosteroid isomerase-like protein